MKPLVTAFLMFLPFSVMSSHAPAQVVRPERDKQIAQTRKLFFETVIATFNVEANEVTFAEFLKLLESHVPPGEKLSIRIDADAFGPLAAKVAAAQVKVRKEMNVGLHGLLRRRMETIAKITEVEIAIRPGEVVVTRPDLALDRVVYDVRDIVGHMPNILPKFKAQAEVLYQGVDPQDGRAILARRLINEVEFRRGETMEFLNGSRLAVTAAPARHMEVEGELDLIRRWWDVAVVMNARLYEVERGFFNRHVAPLFAADKESEERPLVRRIDGPTLKNIALQQLIQESEEVRLPPQRKATFLSRESLHRFAAGPRQEHQLRPPLGSVLSGVVLEVDPLISYDRRHLRLRITERVTQFVGLDKTRVQDAVTGKEIEVETPNLRRSSVSATIELPDTAPVVMPLQYRPHDKADANKVWLLVARPYIHIKEEAPTSAKVWESEVPVDPMPEPDPPPLPNDAATKEILQAIVSDVLTNPDLKSTRTSYGTAKDKTFALVNHGKFSWPKEFQPDSHGFTLVRIKFDPFENRRRILGIRVDKFDLKQKKVDFQDTPIEVCLFNAGGSANGDVIGGCTVYYVPEHDGKRWKVSFAGAIDP